MPIKVLDSELISKIAAGEVIERPASVVKELLENSLDAGANQIGVEAQGAGVELIKVADNGSGIPASEVELAFYRYTTSKIDALADLANISSLGFRGEALPSIAAVAEVEISTQASWETVGSRMYLRNGSIISSESCVRPQGTTVTVRRLFRYFPARLKFLKSTSRENAYIAHVVSQYALAFPEVRFSLQLDKRPGLHTTGSGALRAVVNQVYGLEVARGMLEIEGGDAIIRVGGLISPPSLTRSNRSYFSFFVNRRWVHSPMLMRAVERAYHGLLMDGRHPMVIINISLPAQELDVNVHPTKAEIKFHQEQAIFACLEEAIKATLNKTAIARDKASIAGTESVVPLPTSSWQGIALEGSSLKGQSTGMIREKELPFTAPLPVSGLPVLRVIGQLASTYILAEGPEGLYLIDQHAAHERILYDRIQEQWSRREVEIQGLLQPITIELSPREEETLEESKEILTQFGFAIAPFGDRSYLIRAAPALVKSNLAEAMGVLLDNLATKEGPPWEEKIAQSLACHSAIRAGQQLSDDEMRELIRQLEQAKQPRSCPHGRPTMIHLSLYQLEREFGRRG